ncbi:metal-dependent transcriptional regulator [Eubacteriales bacterium OttesenSCG-928-A19]|nr:metal-dependent transcriptional regulator [Eubacteriales bacterium OttesenSCG-928-A19]
MRLTAAQERYLRAVYDLTLEAEGTSVSDIAAHVGVSKASASVAIQRLERDGLTARRAGKWISLTPEGDQAAALSYGKRAILYGFLAEVLGVPEETAALEADALEPVVSVGTLCALCRRTRQRACESCAQAGTCARTPER